MAQFLSTCFFILISMQLADSSGVFELKVHSFTNTGSVCEQSRDCQIFFRVCLNYSLDVTFITLLCNNGTVQIGTFDADQSFISSSAPITVPFKFKWPGNISLIIEAWNEESSSDQSTENWYRMISHFTTNKRLAVSKGWSHDVHRGEKSELRYSYRVVCDEFYHGDNCSDFCRPRNDPFAHFNCDANGNRVCLAEWKGEYCAEPICSSGCNEDHGYCEAPGECKCRLGWQGPLCDECVKHPECLHGTCSQPWQCSCKEGWGGLFCDRNLNA
ncbi:delta-like protein C [Xyrauchen texanus]|uniref:delta-like protein C n=1 Tax=Xyrauchen texanus TaxID=154827 RepID=UPI002241F474|nr:delta-like protein C [Xyrauchen texanus]